MFLLLAVRVIQALTTFTQDPWVSEGSDSIMPFTSNHDQSELVRSIPPFVTDSNDEGNNPHNFSASSYYNQNLAMHFYQ